MMKGANGGCFHDFMRASWELYPRSGVGSSSVHAFAAIKASGKFFCCASCCWCFAGLRGVCEESRLSQERESARLDDFARIAVFLGPNLILWFPAAPFFRGLCSRCFIRMVSSARISVGATFFNQVNLPLIGA